jgi:(E)-4-hydroxy-3-methylbut-2-enyl-diphosphate synthase
MAFVIKRKKTRQVKVGNVKVGGLAPIAVQSMTNTYTQDIAATVSQIKQLEAAGCEIVRVAVPDEEAAAAISGIKKKIAIPLIADIHFDYRLAILSGKAGADGLRINPGNIGSRKKVKAVVDCAKEYNIPIRIGVNSGSLENDVRRTVEAYRLLSNKSDLPLHVGVTEAGGLYSGIVKSTLGIGMLLAEGIGDTIRVSLTRDPVEEVRVGYEILKGLVIRQHGPDIISCPTCGRCNIDLFGIAERVEKALLLKSVPIKLAIMGCVVNGPGEAREADIGVAGGDGVGILFRKGEVIKKFPQDKLVEVLLEEVEKFEKDQGKKE